MKQRPILFNGAMVRAIHGGQKTQTRRVVNPQPDVSEQGSLMGEWLRRPLNGLILPRLQDIAIHSPFGQVGDHLYVRETWAWHKQAIGAERDEDGPFVYAADHGAIHSRLCDRWRPSIHMPRWASRITLEVTGVRVERLQDISEADAIAEGIEPHYKGWRPYTTMFFEADGETPANFLRDPRESYRQLWNSINGRNSWDTNPWVWVVELKRVSL